MMFGCLFLLSFVTCQMLVVLHTLQPRDTSEISKCLLQDHSWKCCVICLALFHLSWRCYKSDDTYEHKELGYRNSPHTSLIIHLCNLRERLVRRSKVATLLKVAKYLITESSQLYSLIHADRTTVHQVTFINFCLQALSISTIF